MKHFRPILPSFRMSPIPDTPTMSEENTSGTTVMRSKRRNNSPVGSLIWNTTHSTRGSAPPHITLATIPAVAPRINPVRMRVCDMPRDLSRLRADYHPMGFVSNVRCEMFDIECLMWLTYNSRLSKQVTFHWDYWVS